MPAIELLARVLRFLEGWLEEEEVDLHGGQLELPIATMRQPPNKLKVEEPQVMVLFIAVATLQLTYDSTSCYSIFETKSAMFGCCFSS